MKNVQVIDGAINCSYSIYEFTDEEFALIFREPEQDIEFIEDVIARIGDGRTGDILRPVWKRRRNKSEAIGIHGTLFYELANKKKYYPTKREKEMIVVF